MSFDRVLGCLVGAAYGDMLGAGVEFMTLAEIRKVYGPEGHTVPVPACGFPHPVITDDTQMAIATARGIARTPRDELRDNAAVLRNIYEEYRNWYASQRDPRQRRAPGTTCLSALARGVPGSVEKPVNQSMGCGGLMRAHPVGLAFRNDPVRAFRLGCESAALTHGHPNGYLPAGMLANAVARLVGGEDLRAIFKPRPLSASGDHGTFIDTHVGQTPGKGGGWLGHDCLAIAALAALAAPEDPLRAVQIAVNHSGDSDSTGSVAGALLGAIHGAKPFTDELARQGLALERLDEIQELAQELYSRAAV